MYVDVKQDASRGIEKRPINVDESVSIEDVNDFVVGYFFIL